MTFTVFGVTYSYATAPYFVKHGFRLRTGKYGTNFDLNVPSALRYYARDLGRRFCVVQ